MTLAGLRPGEKLFEEKLMAEEGLKKTKYDAAFKPIGIEVLNHYSTNEYR